MEGEVYSQSTCLVFRAAQLYYVEQVPQRIIARELGVSVATVSRLIHRGRDEGVVQVLIREPFASCLRLERDLKHQYGLTEVLVAPMQAAGPPGAGRKAVALEGARLVQRMVDKCDVLGVAWGGTMYHLIHHLNPCRRVPASFVTLHGSISCCGAELDAATLVERMKMAFGGRRFAISHGGLQASATEVARLRLEPDVQQATLLFGQITISVSGLGSLYPSLDSRLARSTYLSKPELERVVEAGAYGDLVLRFFDRNGNECVTDLVDRTLGISLKSYLAIPRKIIVASGAHKAATVAAALRGGMADYLVVDELLAKKMLEHV